MGAERRSAIGEEEKKITAYHEAGHALVATICRILILSIRQPLFTGSGVGNGDAFAGKDRVSMTMAKLLQTWRLPWGNALKKDLGFRKVTTGASQTLVWPLIWQGVW